MAGDSSLLTAQQGDAENREQNRDSKEQCTIHHSNPPKKVPERKGPQLSRPTFFPPPGTASGKGGTHQSCGQSHGAQPQGALNVSLYGLSSLDTNAQSRLLN